MDSLFHPVGASFDDVKVEQDDVDDFNFEDNKEEVIFPLMNLYKNDAI